MEIEKRFFEIRAENSEKGRIIDGYAAVFDKLSENMGGFREKIAPGAFKKTIKKADIRALFDHDSKFVLGRNTSGTLKLSEDETGLRVQITPPAAQWADDLLRSMERGDINQMSFGFYTISDEWEDLNKSTPVRTLREVELFDVSVVTYPAYPDASVAIRGLNHIRQNDHAWLIACGHRSRKINLLNKGITA